MAQALSIAFGGPRGGSLPAARSRLRLTARGRFFLIALPLFLVIVTLAFAVAAMIAPAQASDSPGSTPGVSAVKVTVQSGQSLWGLASDYAPDRDPREVVGEIVELNDLAGGQLQAGQQIFVPESK